MEDLIAHGFIPLDKSWAIRMGILDLVNGSDETRQYLEKNSENLCDDLNALVRAIKQWNKREVIDVGESGTLYRFLLFASWKLGRHDQFITQGTLRERAICMNPALVSWSLAHLLTLDKGTSQWASAAVLLGNQERIEPCPYKLAVTSEAVADWTHRKQQNMPLHFRFDETIARQAHAYARWLETGVMHFVPEQAEDYCFARAFGLMTKEEGERRWPSLRGHESDRILAMEQALTEHQITSRDHRVVQALALLHQSGRNILYPEAVNKSWPQFWQFLAHQVT